MMNHRFRFRVLVSLALTTLFASLAAAAAPPPDGARVARWKTWVLVSGSEIPVPAPPAENSDQSKKELAELRQLQTQRTEITDTTI
jgi:hypothetical protein